MTDRKPDIVTRWSIKKNERNTNFDGEWVATCTAYPNLVICGDDPDRIVFAIKEKLAELYEQHMGYYDGGIIGYTADVMLFLTREKSLDYFSTNVSSSSEVPTDDPTPEPATDAPELHEPTADKLVTVSPKKPKAKKTSKDTRTQLEKELFPKPCSTCFHLSATKQCVCPKSPNYRIIIENPNACTCHCCHETKEQYEKRQSKYVWSPIKELVAGCALCELFRQNKCQGNKEGTSCKRYVCRPDAGSHCATCRNRGEKLPYKQGGEERYMCNHHHQPVSLDDFNCYAVKE